MAQSRPQIALEVTLYSNLPDFIPESNFSSCALLTSVLGTYPEDHERRTISGIEPTEPSMGGQYFPTG
jgi:hypothetical protein